jgi:hypothetical protein
VFFTQPSTAVFMLFFIIPLFFFKDWKKVLIVCAITFALFTTIFLMPKINIYGLENVILGIGISPGIFSGGSNVDTSGGEVPGLSDLMIAPTVSKMDQPTGFGLMLFTLVLIGIILFFVFKAWNDKNYLLSMIWLAAFFILLYGNALPVKLFPHRVWAFLAIPAVIIATFGTWAVISGLNNKVAKTATLLLIIALLLWSCAYPKYVVNTSYWPAGTVWSYPPLKEMEGYTKLKEAGVQDIVMPVCSEEEKPISLGLKSIPYDPEVYNFRNWIWTEGGNSLVTYNFLTEKNIKFITLDHQCFIKHDIEETNKLINEFMIIANPVFANEQVVVLQVK